MCYFCPDGAEQLVLNCSVSMTGGQHIVSASDVIAALEV
jgi:hypothetical protein